MFNPDDPGSVKDALKTRIAVAAGREPAELVLKNARLVDVFSCQIMEGVDIAVQDQRIAGISKEGYAGREVVDLAGQVVVPGLMDGHIHIESTMLTIREFARCVVPRGTTTVVIDPHEIANVLGFEGIMYILESAKYQPLSVHVCLPSCVPATDLETSGSKLSAFDLLSLFQNKWVVALAEMMNFPGVINADSGVLEKIELAGQMARPIDGHAPGLRGKDLNAYVTANVRSDHECVGLDEAAEKLSLGMHIMIREGSLAKNLETLLPLVNERNHTQFMFVTDDRHPHTLRDEGHMDSIIRKAIRLGLDPVLAVKLATINTANYFRLYSVGAVAPGRRADLAVVDDLKSFNVTRVYKNGRLVAQDGKLLYEAPVSKELSLRSTVNIKWLEDQDFDIKANGGMMRVIEIVPRSLYTKEIHLTPKTESGHVVADPGRDIAKIVVIDRHRATHIGVGFVKGFGIKHGAWGQTIAHDSHNIIAVGTNDRDIKKAVVRLRKIGGGIVVVQDEQVLEQLPLPVAGLMTDIPFADVTAALDRLMKAMREKVGCQVEDPFMALAFVALPVIPDLKITDHGLIDVNQFKAVPLWVDQDRG